MSPIELVPALSTVVTNLNDTATTLKACKAPGDPACTAGANSLEKNAAIVRTGLGNLASTSTVAPSLKLVDDSIASIRGGCGPQGNAQLCPIVAQLAQASAGGLADALVVPLDVSTSSPTTT